MDSNLIYFTNEVGDEKQRVELLEECLELGLPVSKQDDIEILRLIYQAAKDKQRTKEPKKLSN